MRYSEINEEFGVPTPSPEQVAKKHGVPLEMITKQMAKGIEIETEHTLDKEMSREIALDHLAEFPDYYDRLEKVEESTLLEYSETIYWGTTKVQVMVNPSKRSLVKFAGQSINSELRGYHHDGKFYFWDSHLLTHRTTAEELGLPYNHQDRLYLQGWHGGWKLILPYGTYDIYKDISYIKNVFYELEGTLLVKS